MFIAISTVSGIIKPFLAMLMAGLNSSFHGNLPYFFHAVSSPFSSPGTATAKPPGNRKESWVLGFNTKKKRALSHIFPRVPYCEALELAQIEAIRDRQNHLTKKLFQSVVNDPSNKLHALLPTRCNVGYNLRRERRFAQPFFRTKRFADSLVNRCVSEEMYS